MRIAVIGAGYVGLVTGVCLAEVDHQVTCIDTDINKIKKLNKGISPIYEPGLEELIIKNIQKGNLQFHNEYDQQFKEAEVIIIAVGTPQLQDGSADLKYISLVAETIGKNIERNVVVVTKSTVPVGTNHLVEKTVRQNLVNKVNFSVASNPEFLREGSAIQDTFNGDRIILGTNDEKTAKILTKLYEPFHIPIFHTDISSAEMIKYASNAFLATKISFINEISNICEKLGANIEDVADGMGMDKRIGRSFLNAGIGYGGSCFPKDTQALVQIAGGVEHDFQLLKSVIEVNNKQQRLLVDKIKTRIGNLAGKKIALLGLAFKPNTDDMREAASIVISKLLSSEKASIIAYDPISMENAKTILPVEIEYVNSVEKAISGADVAVIVTEWEEFKNIDLNNMKFLMKTPIIFDGRNCFEIKAMKEHEVEYHSVGRPSIYQENLMVKE